jgi:hypothetical protein
LLKGVGQKGSCHQISLGQSKKSKPHCAYCPKVWAKILAASLVTVHAWDGVNAVFWLSSVLLIEPVTNLVFLEGIAEAVPNIC